MTSLCVAFNIEEVRGAASPEPNSATARCKATHNFHYVRISFGQIHKYICAKISVSSGCCLSGICRPLSNREPLNEFSSNPILGHWNGCQCMSKCSYFGYTLQQQWTIHMIFRAHFAKYISERKIFRRDAA